MFADQISTYKILKNQFIINYSTAHALNIFIRHIFVHTYKYLY